jgi:hypothetical protein
MVLAFFRGGSANRDKADSCRFRAQFGAMFPARDPVVRRLATLRQPWRRSALPTAQSALAFSAEKQTNPGAADSCRFRPHCGPSFPAQDDGGARIVNVFPTLSPIAGASGENSPRFFSITPANRQAPDSRGVRSCFGPMFPQREPTVGATLTMHQ